jgi:hypothetical protein
MPQARCGRLPAPLYLPTAAALEGDEERAMICTLRHAANLALDDLDSVVRHLLPRPCPSPAPSSRLSIATPGSRQRPKPTPTGQQDPNQVTAGRLKARHRLSNGKPDGCAGPENTTWARLIVETAKDVSQPETVLVEATL